MRSAGRSITYQLSAAITTVMRKLPMREPPGRSSAMPLPGRSSNFSITE
jgi:hypothetical protein